MDSNAANAAEGTGDIMVGKFELWDIEWRVGDIELNIRRDIREAAEAGRMTATDRDHCEGLLRLAGSDDEDLGEEGRKELVSLIQSARGN